MSDTSRAHDPDEEFLLQFQREYEAADDKEAVVRRYCDLRPDLAPRIRVRAKVPPLLDISVVPTEEPLPQRLGDFRVVRRIASGGMGAVYEAWDDRLKRRVAVKTIRPDRATAAARDRFLREQRVLARLHHTHVVSILQAGEEGAVHYLVMPYIDGAALSHLVQTVLDLGSSTPPGQTPSLAELAAQAAVKSQEKDQGSTVSTTEATLRVAMPPPAAARSAKLTLSATYFRSVAAAMADVAAAVQHIHEAGFVHRDMKPSNLMVDRSGHCWVIDLGLAGARGGEEDKSAKQSDPVLAIDPVTTRGVLGTPHYMAPEQWRRDREADLHHPDQETVTPEPGKQSSSAPGVLPVDARTDVYGMGVTLYELLTLRRAFDGENQEEIAAKALAQEPLRPRRLVANIPRDLEAVCRKAMKKSSAERYPTAFAFAEDLGRWLLGEPTRAAGWYPFRLFWLWVRRHRSWAVACVIALLAIGTVGLVYHRHSLIGEATSIRLGLRSDGWRDRAWSYVRKGSKIYRDDTLQNQAGAILLGVDAKNLRRFKVESSAVAVDSRNRRVLMAGTKRRVDGKWETTPARLWDENERKEILSQKKGEGPVVFDEHDNPLQLVEEQGLTLLLWNVEKQRLVGEYRVPLPEEQAKQAWQLTALDLSARGDFVAAVARNFSSQKGVLAVWETKSGKICLKQTSHASAVAFGRSGPWFAAADGGEITIWSLQDGTRMKSLPTGRRAITTLAFGRHPGQVGAPGPSAELLAVGEVGGAIMIWDVSRQLPISMCRGSSYAVHALTFSEDGATLASAGRTAAKIWDVTTGQLLLSVGDRNTMTGLALSPDGSRLAVSSVAAFGDPGGVDFWQLEWGQGLQAFRGLSGPIAQVRFSPDGRRVAALAHNWQVAITEVSSGRLEHVLDVPQGMFADNAALAFSPDGQRFAFATGQEAQIWNLATGKVERSWQLPSGYADQMGYRGDKLLLFRVERRDGSGSPFVCRMRNLLGPQPLVPYKVITDFPAGVNRAGAPADGRYLLLRGAGGNPGIVKAYDTSTGKELWSKQREPRLAQEAVSFVFDPSASLMTLTTDPEANGVSLVEMPSGTVLPGPLASTAQCLGPSAAYWGVPSGSPPYGFRLYRRKDQVPVVLLGLDTLSTQVHAEFNPTGTHVVWGIDGGAILCDIEEVRRRLGELGMGW
jgi:eukaryotic-like serine/threonine-protein kinase